MITAEPIDAVARRTTTQGFAGPPCPPAVLRRLLPTENGTPAPRASAVPDDVLREFAAYLASSLVDVEVGPVPLGAGDGWAEEVRLTFRVRTEPAVRDDGLAAAVAGARKRLGLTAREAEVLTMLGRHATNREIAEALVISVRTAEHHVAHILRKLGVATRRDAAALARSLVAPPAPCEPARPALVAAG